MNQIGPLTEEEREELWRQQQSSPFWQEQHAADEQWRRLPDLEKERLILEPVHKMQQEAERIKPAEEMSREEIIAELRQRNAEERG